MLTTERRAQIRQSIQLQFIDPPAQTEAASWKLPRKPMPSAIIEIEERRRDEQRRRREESDRIRAIAPKVVREFLECVPQREIAERYSITIRAVYDLVRAGTTQGQRRSIRQYHAMTRRKQVSAA